MEEEIKKLIGKAAIANDSGDCMRFSQAAVNAANAVSVLSNIGKHIR
jgi:hypothetical protein